MSYIVIILGLLFGNIKKSSSEQWNIPFKCRFCSWFLNLYSYLVIKASDYTNLKKIRNSPFKKWQKSGQKAEKVIQRNPNFFGYQFENSTDKSSLRKNKLCKVNAQKHLITNFLCLIKYWPEFYSMKNVKFKRWSKLEEI